MFLLDTNVVSELRKMRPHGAVLAWVKSKKETELFISAVTLGELQAGVELTRAHDRVKVEQIEEWVDRVANSFQILPMDAATFRECGRLMHKRSDALYEDAMIAATARVHRLKVATRNIRDFGIFDVPVLNPFV